MGWEDLVTALSEFGSKALDFISRRNDRAAGANEVTAKDLKGEKDAAQKALDAAVSYDPDSTVDRLRNGGF